MMFIRSPLHVCESPATTADTQQTALVLLNKGSAAQSFEVSDFMQSGDWTEQLSGDTQTVEFGDALTATVEPNGVQVWVREGQVSNSALLSQIKHQLARQ